MIGTRDPGGWLCIGHNPVSGVSTWAIEDGDDDIIVQERQDISALLDENKAIRSVTEAGWKGDGLHSVARVPVALVHDRNSLLGGAISASDDKVVSRLLNDSDYSKLRTKDGQV